MSIKLWAIESTWDEDDWGWRIDAEYGLFLSKEQAQGKVDALNAQSAKQFRDREYEKYEADVVKFKHAVEDHNVLRQAGLRQGAYPGYAPKWKEPTNTYGYYHYQVSEDPFEVNDEEGSLGIRKLERSIVAEGVTLEDITTQRPPASGKTEPHSCATQKRRMVTQAIHNHMNLIGDAVGDTNSNMLEG